MIDEMNYRNKIRRKRKAKKAASISLTYFLLLIIAFVCAGPFIWLFITSLKSGENIYDLTLFFKPTLDSYIGVAKMIDLPRILSNTIYITVMGILLDVFLSALCAYPLARMEFYGKKLIFNALMGTMVIPAAAGLVVNYITVDRLNLIDKLAGVIIPSAVTVFGIILLRQAYLGIPKSLTEAAKIDGASELKTWYSIMVPQIMPAVSTLVIFDFIGRWNAFLWPIVVIQDRNKFPLATALRYLATQFVYKFGNVAAGSVISIIPVIIIFLIFQKHFINTISGAVKG